MATVADLQTDMQAISDGVAVLAKEIADLKANGGVVTQAELDTIDAKAKEVVAAIEAAK